MRRLALQHQGELADGFVHLAGIKQNAAITGMGFQVVRIGRSPACNWPAFS